MSHRKHLASKSRHLLRKLIFRLHHICIKNRTMNETNKTKQCTKCGEIKAFEYFYKYKTSKDGLQSSCKECRKKYYEQNKEKIAARNKKYYGENKEELAARNKKHREQNKEEIAAYHKKYREENKGKIAAYSKKYREENKEEIAAKKKKWQDENKENIAAQRKKYREQNKEKIAAIQKKYYRDNKENILASVKKHYGDNKEEIAAYHKKYREENKGKINAQQRERYSNDPDYKMKMILSRSTRRALNGEMKASPTRELLGCTFKQARAHIKKQFKPGMNWDNWKHDGWHVDHIIPLASFDMSDPDQQRRANHYTNLQPMWAAENMSKSDSIPDNHQEYLPIAI